MKMLKNKIIDTFTYVRDGKQCVGYKVIIDRRVIKAKLRKLYEEIIQNDGYYKHTVWFYIGRYEIGQMPFALIEDGVLKTDL